MSPDKLLFLIIIAELLTPPLNDVCFLMEARRSLKGWRTLTYSSTLQGGQTWTLLTADCS